MTGSRGSCVEVDPAQDPADINILFSDPTGFITLQTMQHAFVPGPLSLGFIFPYRIFASRRPGPVAFGREKRPLLSKRNPCFIETAIW